MSDQEHPNKDAGEAAGENSAPPRITRRFIFGKDVGVDTITKVLQDAWDEDHPDEADKKT